MAVYLANQNNSFSNKLADTQKFKGAGSKSIQLLMLFILCLVGLTVGQTKASAHEVATGGIEVSGNAQIMSEPDIFIARFSISKKGVNASKLKINVDHKSQLLVDYARKLGIKERDIQSARMSVWSHYEEPSIKFTDHVVTKAGDNTWVKGQVNGQINDNNQPKKKLVFTVSRDITVKLRKIEGYEKLLDRATKVGVSNVSPLTMEFSNAEGLYQQALDTAFENAKAKAQRLANKLGQKLGPVIHLKEQGYRAPSTMVMHAESFGDVSRKYRPNVGQQAISAQVNVKFAIE